MRWVLLFGLESMTHFSLHFVSSNHWSSSSKLFVQVINGLMERPDWEQAIKTPVGILPCGSGNALAGSINHNAG